MFGTWAAAWPLIRDDLALSYVQVGILLSLPHLLGSLIELPLFLLADRWRRRAVVRAGGVLFACALALVANADTFPAILLALLLANPASGAFVGLSQAVLMDAEPDRREQNMARWSFAGALGALAAPLALAGLIGAGLGWRAAFVVFAALSLALLAPAWRVPMPLRAPPDHGAGQALRSSVRDAIRALRDRDVVRWLVLLQFSDLMLDVFHGYLALYFVDVVGASGAGAAAGILVWTGAGLLGQALMIPLLERIEGPTVLPASAAAMLGVFPLFLLVEPPAAKLVLLAGVALLASGWYAVLKGRLYAALPGRSGAAIALGNVFGLAGAALPFSIGLAAAHWGLATAMWLLLAGPLALLLGGRGASGGPSKARRPRLNFRVWLPNPPRRTRSEP